MTHHRRVVEADGAPPAVGPYVHGVVSNGLLFCSAQVPLDPHDGNVVSGDAGAHVRRCLDNLAAVCASAEAQIQDAVRMTIYLTDLAGDWDAVNEAYGAFFADSAADPPARTAVGVDGLPRGAGVAIDAVVALPD